MRTTVDLPDDLIREAKAASALRGISLKTYITEALMRYRGHGGGGSGEFATERVRLPLVGRPGGPCRRPSNEDLEQALAESENLHAAP